MVRGKVVKVSYFQKQGLGVFLEKLEALGWLDLFMNTTRGCSVPNLAEFYTNCVITNKVVTSIVNGHEVRFDDRKLGKLLGVFLEGLDVYVHEDKSALGDEQLYELTWKLVQKPHLTEFQSVRKGKMMPLH